MELQNRVIFMGTPGFAVESLKEVTKVANVVGVVTAPDRPAGRGRKLKSSDVKIAAEELGIKVMQPEKLKSEEFLTELKELNADLFVVVAFRMLPKVVWDMPKYGTINLHGSLLPQYRGAAPINWAIINGEKKSGATTFFIEEKIDTGNIIDNVEVEILEEDNAGTFHDKLMVEGADLLRDTVTKIFLGKAEGVPQEQYDLSNLNEAPKIFKETCRINWVQDQDGIYDFIRGLSPYPGAWTEFSLNENLSSLKVFKTSKTDKVLQPGQLVQDNNELFIGTKTLALKVEELQLAGKKRMITEDLLRGYSFNNNVVFK